MKIVLVTEAQENAGYSLESGLADNVRHFDHHKEEHRHFPSPCNNWDIPVIPEDAIVQITHLDADTFIGLKRMLGMCLPSIDLNMVEKIDLNGSSVCPDKNHPSLMYMIGVSTLARKSGMPRSEKGVEHDVTATIEELLIKSDADIISLGRQVKSAGEKAYKDCLIGTDKNSRVGYWSIGEDDDFDPSLPYERGIETVVVYRKHYKSISIYGQPTSDRTYGGKVFAGIQFNGHPKACGSPRGEEFQEEDGLKVYLELCDIYKPQ